MTTNLRGKIFIDRSVQGALVKRILVHWCLFFLLATVSLLGLEAFAGDPNLTFDARLGAFWNKYAMFFLLMLAVVPSFVYDTIKLSHRFAGPVLRLKNSLRKLADGEEVGPIKFRDGDFWMSIAGDFNRVAERVDALKVHTSETAEESVDSSEEDTLEVVGCGQ